MAGSTAVLAVRIIGDAAGAKKSFAEAEGAAGKFAGNMSKMSGVSLLAGLGAGAALTKGLFDAVDADSANRKLAGQLNLGAADAEAAGKLAGDLYGNAYGDSLEDVNGAISAVASTLTTMSSNGGADVERLTKKALDLSSTFGTDVNEAVTTAGILMKTGLAKDGDQAMDLLVGSMQKMPASLRAEVLPVMDEYSKHFAALGIDGPTAFGLIANASKDGAIQMDKVGDSLKEFTIRATDGSKASADAYAAIGLDAKQMARDVAAGGPAAEEAFAKTVAGLQSITDPAAQAQAAIGLFGTPLEDLGTNKIPEFLGQIDPAGDAFDDMAGAAERLGDTVSSGPGVALESFTRGAGQKFQQFFADALPFIEPVLGVLMQFLPAIVPIALAIGLVTTAQMAWNAAQAANPVGLIVIAVVAFIAAIIWAYQNVGWFKDAVDAMGSAAVAVWNWVVEGVQKFIRLANEALAPVGGIQGAMDLMGAAAADVWQGLIGWIEDAIGWFDDVLQPIGGIDGAIKGLQATADVVFGAINGAIEGTIGWIKDAISWFASLFASKDKANSAPVGNADGGAMPLMSPAPVALMGASALMGTQSLTGASTDRHSLTHRHSGTRERVGEPGRRCQRFSREQRDRERHSVKADATTDGAPARAENPAAHHQ